MNWHRLLPVIGTAKPEKVTVPEEVMPVAAATAPEELTWKKNGSDREAAVGLVTPIPSL